MVPDACLNRNFLPLQPASLRPWNLRSINAHAGHQTHPTTILDKLQECLDHHGTHTNLAGLECWLCLGKGKRPEVSVYMCSEFPCSHQYHTKYGSTADPFLRNSESSQYRITPARFPEPPHKALRIHNTVRIKSSDLWSVYGNTCEM